MQTYMINTTNPLEVISGTFDPTVCAKVNTTPIGNPDDVGFYLEGLSIIANVTANNLTSTYRQM